MYDTLIHDVKAHIDSKTAVHDTIHVKGWSFSEISGVCPVRCKYDGTVRGVDIDTRQDVCDRFKRNNLILSGWKISVPPNKYVDLQIKLGTEWVTFLSFHSVASTSSDSSDSSDSSTDFVHNLETALQNVEVSTTKTSVENPTNEVVIPPYGANLENVVQHFLQDFIKRNPHVNPATTTVNVINVASNNTTLSDVYVLDNFYENPDDIRKVALSTLGQTNTSNYVKEVPMFKKQFEKIMNVSLTPFTKYDSNGTFSCTTSADSAQLEKKAHQYEGIIFLTPDAPISSGITFYRSAFSSPSWENKKLEDSTDLVAVDSVGNVYNRLVIFNTKKIHACPHMFGGDKTNGRLIQTFAFDLE
jgi:hypothetical protein